MLWCEAEGGRNTQNSFALEGRSHLSNINGWTTK